jgi:hypothetical protein
MFDINAIIPCIESFDQHLIQVLTSPFILCLILLFNCFDIISKLTFHYFD